MANTKRNTWGGSRAGAGRRRRATAQRNGRVYVALDSIRTAKSKNGITFACVPGMMQAYWLVDDMRYNDYADAAAEFVRRVNG